MLLFSVRSSIFSYFRSSRSLSSCSYDFFFSIVLHLEYCDYIFTCIHTFFWAVSKQCSNVPVFAVQEVRSDVINNGVFTVSKMDCECGHFLSTPIPFALLSFASYASYRASSISCSFLRYSSLRSFSFCGICGILIGRVMVSPRFFRKHRITLCLYH